MGPTFSAAGALELLFRTPIAAVGLTRGPRTDTDTANSCRARKSVLWSPLHLVARGLLEFDVIVHYDRAMIGEELGFVDSPVLRAIAQPA